MSAPPPSSAVFSTRSALPSTISPLRPCHIRKVGQRRLALLGRDPSPCHIRKVVCWDPSTSTAASASSAREKDTNPKPLLAAPYPSSCFRDQAAHSGVPMEAATSTRLMALLDRDGNGEVDFNEFLAMHKRLPAKI